MLARLETRKELKKLLVRALAELDDQEIKVFLYMLKEVSVGEIIAVRELELNKIMNPRDILVSLVRKGWFVYSGNVFSLSRWVKDILLELSNGKKLPEIGSIVAEVMERVLSDIEVF